MTYDQFLLALAEQEIAQRDANQQKRRIKAARFPVLKELADFDFSVLPHLNKAQVLELARGTYIPKAEPILLLGQPGLGKTHVATGLALAAVRQGYKVRPQVQCGGGSAGSTTCCNCKTRTSCLAFWLRRSSSS